MNSTIMQNKKLWNPKSFIIFSVFFSLLPAGIMYSLNFGRSGNNKKQNISLTLTIVGFIILTALAVLLPIPDTISKAIYFGINVGAGIYFMNDQKSLYENYIQNGGKRASYLIPIIISVLLLVLSIVAIIYSSYIPDKSITYDKSQIYYTNNVTKSEAQKLGDYLKEQGVFSSNSESDMKIDKKKDVYIFSLIINDDSINNKEVTDSMPLISKELSENVFNNKKVQVDLCDTRFKVLKSFNSN
ncbi:hypothetical protein SAMN02745163_01558 [Clostridium cavendishii DSM 21758]|uniref:Uncharacterized protein n=1 Tax=Clostridium cavendishii DSM 21758 TaxID=1121302 RepID=A0A1M6HRV4_9CLOT|nr:hypothetical protein [Clostridium cavendishii]SHJ24888.1 hypothetical protein SAMN02745163_01558 [Clostridium cavendishii DSM 21758]